VIRFLTQRLALAVVTLWMLSIVTFTLGAMAPGGPAEVKLGQRATAEAIAAFNREHGLDKPWPERYARWMSGAVHGDWGVSLLRDEPIAETLRERYPLTATLALIGGALAVLVGIPLGFLASLRPGSWLDRLATTTALTGVSVPSFVILPLLVLGFSLRLHWFPATYEREWGHLFLPAIALGVRPAALIARMTRASFLETLGQDYVRTARAKGVSWIGTLVRHAGRNALIPVLTVLGTSVGYMLGGSFVVETIFGVPGVGEMSVKSIAERDYPMIQAVTLLAAVLFIAVNLLVDILYGFIDPRLRAGGTSRA
jgi:ABC-type dipeptide/oligopeptide/nickel transport system permease component